MTIEHNHPPHLISPERPVSNCPRCKLNKAAPALLEACKDLYKIMVADNLMPESVSYMKNAEAAIAKATGE